MEGAAGHGPWVPALTPDGKPYFYHAVTRETAWSLPPGATVVPPTPMPMPFLPQPGAVGGGPLPFLPPAPAGGVAWRPPAAAAGHDAGSGSDGASGSSITGKPKEKAVHTYGNAARPSVYPALCS